jgi:hypothetical protein
MLSKASKKRVYAATVTLTDLGGQGLLIPGGFILTAAHCIEWDGTGGMVLGDSHYPKIKSRDGNTFLGSLWVVEPVADIAVLSEPDGQVFFDDCERFTDFLQAVEPVPLNLDPWAVQEPRRVHVLTHHSTWGE